MRRMTRDPRLWAALSYALGVLSGVLVLVYEKQDQYIRFHAMQSVLTFATVALVGLVLPTVPIVGDIGPVRVLYWASVFFLWILLMAKAVRGEAYRVPYLGDLAHAMSSK